MKTFLQLLIFSFAFIACSYDPEAFKQAYDKALNKNSRPNACPYEHIFYRGNCVKISDDYCGNNEQDIKACDSTRECKFFNNKYSCECKKYDEKNTTFCHGSDQCDINLESDERHCGKCFNRCDEQERCEDGKCVCKDAKGDLVPEYNTNDNCGSCGNKCPKDHQCDSGICICSENSDQKLSTCDETGNCNINLLTDENHCGKCNNKCPLNAKCNQGKCECAPNHLLCVFEGVSQCVPNDKKNCGKCGRSCDENTQFCTTEGENITCECSEGYTRYPEDGDNFECVDLQTNPNHCGNFNTECKEDENYFKRCENGKCVPLTCTNGKKQSKRDPESCGEKCATCDSNQNCIEGLCTNIDCHKGEKACEHECTDVTQNPQHCGECNKQCTDDQQCRDGHCVCPPNKPNLCDNQCVDVQDNREHCGKCNNVCDRNERCGRGTCKRCGWGKTLCGNQCVKLNDDSSHCGSCYNTCLGRSHNNLCWNGKCDTCKSKVGKNWCRNRNHPEGRVCFEDTGLCGCNAAQDCPDGKKCENKRCVDQNASTPMER